MENELVKQGTTEIDIFAEDGFDGFIGMDDPKCLVTPRLNIAQSNSKALDPSDEKAIDGLRVGEWYNDVATKSYGKTINFVTIIMYPNVTKWGEGIGNFESAMTTKEFQKILKSGDLFEVNGKYYTTANPAPNAAHFRYNINLIGFIPEHIEDGLMVYSASGTSFTPAKKFANKMQAVGGKIFSYVWEMGTVQAKGDKGSYYKLKPGNKVESVIDKPELVQFIKNNAELAKSWLSQQSHIDYGTDEVTIRNVNAEEEEPTAF